MSISAAKTVCALELLVERDLLIHLQDQAYGFDEGDIYHWARRLGGSESAARAAMESLEAAGMIALDPGRAVPSYMMYRLTPAGNLRAVSRQLKQVSHARARQLVADIHNQARKINRNYRWLDSVCELALFGSCLDGAAVGHGDINIAYRTRTRYDEADYDNFHSRGMEQFYWGKERQPGRRRESCEAMLRDLRQRRNHICLLPWRDLLGFGCEYRTIYIAEEEILTAVEAQTREHFQQLHWNFMHTNFTLPVRARMAAAGVGAQALGAGRC